MHVLSDMEMFIYHARSVEMRTHSIQLACCRTPL